MIEALKRRLFPPKQMQRPIVIPTRFLARKLKTLGYTRFREACWVSRDQSQLAVTWAVGTERSAYYVVPNPHRQESAKPQNNGRMIFQPFRSRDEVSQVGEAPWFEATEAHVSADGSAACKIVDDDGKGFRWCLALPGKWRFV